MPKVDEALLAQSYEHCRNVAKKQAGNFYYSFMVLPTQMRLSMCAIYAFMRESDDLSDDPSLSVDRSKLFPKWRAALDRALEGDYGDSLILPAFHDTVVRCNIPKRFFHEVIDGAEMDLVQNRYETFDDLAKYCYHVASVVGFVCIHVWGFDGGEAAYVPAEACGIAFQLTNILRDLREDADRGRIYLPLEDLRRFNYSEQDLIAGVKDERFRELMQFEVRRARDYYEKALPLIPMLHPEGRKTFSVMYRIYRGLLDRIEMEGYDVFSHRVSLPKAKKASIMAKALLGIGGLPG